MVCSFCTGTMKESSGLFTDFLLAPDTIHPMVQSAGTEVKFLHRDRTRPVLSIHYLKQYPGTLSVCDSSLGPIRHLFNVALTLQNPPWSNEET